MCVILASTSVIGFASALLKWPKRISSRKQSFFRVVKFKLPEKKQKKKVHTNNAISLFVCHLLSFFSLSAHEIIISRDREKESGLNACGESCVLWPKAGDDERYFQFSLGLGLSKKIFATNHAPVVWFQCNDLERIFNRSTSKFWFRTIKLSVN